MGTHERLRRAYPRLVRPNRDRMLFAFCVTPDHWTATRTEPAENDEPAPGTMTGVQPPAVGVDAHESGLGIRAGRAGDHTNRRATPATRTNKAHVSSLNPWRRSVAKRKKSPGFHDVSHE